LHDLAERLQKARENDDYVETDLRTWTTILEKLKCDVITVPPSIHVYEDSTKLLIGKLHVSSTKQNLIQEERFGEFVGDICIEDNGRVALYSGSYSSNSYVRGKEEYSNGKHKIRVIINKKTATYAMSFSIVSKSTPISQTTSDTETHIAYGWYTDDDIHNPDSSYQVSKNFKDLQGETTFELELIIDCDNRKISYFNERTKNTHEMNVNIDICPFPWQLEFYLFYIGDRVQIVSSSQVF